MVLVLVLKAINFVCFRCLWIWPCLKRYKLRVCECVRRSLYIEYLHFLRDVISLMTSPLWKVKLCTCARCMSACLP